MNNLQEQLEQAEEMLMLAKQEVPQIKGAYAGLISYNKKNLARELQNERRHQSVHRTDYRQQGRTKRREEELQVCN